MTDTKLKDALDRFFLMILEEINTCIHSNFVPVMLDENKLFLIFAPNPLKPFVIITTDETNYKYDSWYQFWNGFRPTLNDANLIKAENKVNLTISIHQNSGIVDKTQTLSTLYSLILERITKTNCSMVSPVTHLSLVKVDSLDNETFNLYVDFFWYQFYLAPRYILPIKA